MLQVCRILKNGMGCICILFGSIGTGYYARKQIQIRYQVMKECAFLLMKMEHLLIVTNIPVVGMLEELKVCSVGEWNSFLNGCMEQLQKEDGKTLGEIWRDQSMLFFEKTYVKKEERKLIDGMVQAMLSKDKAQMKTELEYLKKEQEWMEKELLQKKKEMERIAVAIGGAVGIIAILLLN